MFGIVGLFWWIQCKNWLLGFVWFNDYYFYVNVHIIIAFLESVGLTKTVCEFDTKFDWYYEQIISDCSYFQSLLPYLTVHDADQTDDHVGP